MVKIERMESHNFLMISRWAYSCNVDKNILTFQMGVCLSCGLLYTKYTAIPAATEVKGVT
jgi:hypothetical protein